MVKRNHRYRATGFPPKLSIKSREWQSHIEEKDVGVVVFPRPFQGLPYRHQVGMQGRIGLAAGGQIPQIYVALAEHAQAAADNLFTKQGDKHLPVIAFVKLFYLFLGRNQPSDLHLIEAAEQLVELMHLGRRGCRPCLYAEPINVFYTVFHPLREAFLGRHRVERVVNLLPVDGEIALTAEQLVAEHLA